MSFQGPCDWIILYTLLLSIMAVTRDSPPLFITVNICLHPATADCGPAPLEDKYPSQTKETQPATTMLLMKASQEKKHYFISSVIMASMNILLSASPNALTLSLHWELGQHEHWEVMQSGSGDLMCQFLVKCVHSNVFIFIFFWLLNRLALDTNIVRYINTSEQYQCFMSRM